MANHELSGPLAWSILYRSIKSTGPHKYSYRFLICPENIGAAAFLHYNKKMLKILLLDILLIVLATVKNLPTKNLEEVIA